MKKNLIFKENFYKKVRIPYQMKLYQIIKAHFLKEFLINKIKKIKKKKEK
jgi:hypothetical protein